MFDAFPDSSVEVWALNMDAGLDWLEPYRLDYDLQLPIIHHAGAAFERFRLGRAHRNAPPLYIVIDRRGVIRYRSWGQGSIALEEVAELVERLLEE